MASSLHPDGSPTFEDDLLQYKLLGREDQHEVVRGGTTEAPTGDVPYA